MLFRSHGELAVRGCYPADGIPLVLIGLDGIAKRRPGTADVTLAHELGHVLGLEHAAGQNLMATEPPSCVPWLTALQRAQVGQMLAPR